VNRRRANRAFGGAQIAAAAGLAFMHGAQDGQKFMSIGMLAVTLAAAQSSGNPVEGLSYPIWIMAFCSLAMGLGTAIGGRRIIKTVAMDMVDFEKFEGFAASAAACLCIALATFTGLPVSTTHTKTTAIMGVGAAKRLRGVKWSTAKDMGFTWLATFPGCGLIGFTFAFIVRQVL
jgi:PiT family inorganic phosphate transporter